MQITDRDKKLIVILLMVLIAFGFYNFFYKPYSEKLSNLISEKQALENKLNEINQKIAMYNLSKEKLEEIEELYNNLSNKIPPNQDEKFSMLDLQKLSQMVGAKTSDYTISQKQKLNLNLNNLNIVNAFYYSSKQNWQLTYANFKKLLYLQKEFVPLFSLDSISLSNANDKLNISFEIKFYGFEDNLAQPRQWPNFVLPTGKGDIFKGGTAPKVEFDYTTESIKKNETSAQQELKMERTDNVNERKENQTTAATTKPTSTSKDEPAKNEQALTQQVEENVDYSRADFAATISTLYSPSTNITLEKTGKISIFGAKKNVENAYIEIQKKADKYYFKMGTEADVFPKSGLEQFTPNSSKSILIVIFSNPRKFKDDNNVVTLTVKNTTGTSVKVYVLNDDKQKPRVNIVANGSNIQVIKK